MARLVKTLSSPAFPHSSCRIPFSCTNHLHPLHSLYSTLSTKLSQLSKIVAVESTPRDGTNLNISFSALLGKKNLNSEYI